MPPLSVNILILVLLHFHGSLAGFLAEPAQPLKPPPSGSGDSNTVPAFPVQTDSQNCHLDLSAELFGGVRAACGRNLDRSRCCPVLAAWLYAAHARSALQVPEASVSASSDLPMMPDDSQKCVNSLQSSLTGRNIHIPQPNASCDAVLCFCGIRLHQITSLRCSAAFNFSITGNHRNATPTAAVRNLEHNCNNSSYAGCTRCLGALNKLKVESKNATKGGEEESESEKERASKMLERDCQLMGLTWLLARNKTAYIPTVSAVLRAIMYSAHPPRESTCSPDQENMPLAVDSLQLDKYYDGSLSSSTSPDLAPLVPLEEFVGDEIDYSGYFRTTQDFGMSEEAIAWVTGVAISNGFELVISSHKKREKVKLLKCTCGERYRETLARANGSGGGELLAQAECSSGRTASDRANP